MKPERLSSRLERMSRVCVAEKITLRQLLRELGLADHAFVTLVMAVCFMHPIPMPGLSWGLAGIILIAGLRLARGQGLWLPSRLIDKPIRSDVPAKVFRAAAGVLRRCEGLIKPRFN